MIGDADAKKFFYHTDHVGSVRAVTDDVGKVVWKSDYLAFGTQFGKDKLDPSFEEDEFAFTGKGFDGDTGLYYYNARWYDAETGRFMSEDPAFDSNSPNLYAYCRNNPLRFTDSTGLISQEDAMSEHAKNSSAPPSYDWSGNYSYSGGPSYSPNIERGSLKTKNEEGRDVWIMGYYVDGVFVPSDQHSGISSFVEYWSNLSRAEYTDNQLIAALTVGIGLFGREAIPEGFNIREWKISDRIALGLIMSVVSVVVQEQRKSMKIGYDPYARAFGLIQMPYDGLLGLHYEKQAGTICSWGRPDFIADMMVIGLYWNYLHPESYLAFNDISRSDLKYVRYLSDGKGHKKGDIAHKGHREGDEIDFGIMVNGVNITKIFDRDDISLNADMTYQKNIAYISQFFSMVTTIFPNTFHDVLWCDPSVSSLVNKDRIYNNDKLRWAHANHIHMGF